jgi:hypothetical protein
VCTGHSNDRRWVLDYHTENRSSYYDPTNTGGEQPQHAQDISAGSTCSLAWVLPRDRVFLLLSFAVTAHTAQHSTAQHSTHSTAGRKTPTWHTLTEPMVPMGGFAEATARAYSSSFWDSSVGTAAHYNTSTFSKKIGTWTNVADAVLHVIREPFISPLPSIYLVVRSDHLVVRSGHATPCLSAALRHKPDFALSLQTMTGGGTGSGSWRTSTWRRTLCYSARVGGRTHMVGACGS